MNIWYIHPFSGGPGIGRLFRPYSLGQEWLRLGHDVVVVTASFHHQLDRDVEQPPDQVVDGVRYVAVPVRRYSGNGLGRILNMLDFALGVGKLGGRAGKDIDRPDAIIVSSPHPFALLHAWWLSRRLGARFVYEVRDLWPLSIKEMLGVSALHPFVLLCGWLERFAYRRADVVVSLLGGVDQYVRSIGLTPKAFFWAPNGVEANGAPGVEPTTSAGAAAAAQITAWRAEDRMVLIYAGTIGPPNGLDVLVDAVAVANAAGLAEKLGVLIIGQGTVAEQIAAQIAGHGLKNVAMFPAVPKGEAVWLISQADAGYGGLKAHDEVFKYGTSQNKIMDYMLAGLPVVFPIKAYKDPVTESGGGVAVDRQSAETIAQAIATLVDAGPDARREMGERGRAYVRANFDWRTIAAGYADAMGGTSRG